MSTLSAELLTRNDSITVTNARTLITNFNAKKKDIIDGDYKESNPN